MFRQVYFGQAAPIARMPIRCGSFSPLIGGPGAAQRRCAVLVAGLVLLASGCHSMNNTQAGALIGSGFGALTGAMIGAGSGHPEGGALIGAATGALAGGLIGNAEDARQERDAALAHAAYAEYSKHAVTNLQVIQLTQSGVSDEVIISTIQSQGGRFDLSPQAIIALKNSGVSDRVILAMQNYGSPIRPVAVIAEPAPAVVVVPPPPPGPRFHFSIGTGPRRGWYHRHCW